MTLWDPAASSACKSISCSGRNSGTNQVINGVWGPTTYILPDDSTAETYNNKRIYMLYQLSSGRYIPTSENPLYMWYDHIAGRWYIAKSLGSRSVVAEVHAQTLSPESVKGWRIADGSNGFETAPDYVCSCLNETDSITGEVVPLAPKESTSELLVTQQDKNIYGNGENGVERGMVQYRGIMTFQFDTAKWLFLAVANCDSYCYSQGNYLCQGGLDVDYNLEFVNGVGWV